ncbi:MAG: hypothetical protein HGB30_05150 [Holophagaceae bacterium]|nr:hypothetical protein [Holophagaceae bacterium]
MTGGLQAAVAACDKAKGIKFYPMPLPSALAVARQVIMPKDLMVYGHLDPNQMEVVETPEGHLLCLKCEVIGHTPTPYPLNERFLDQLSFVDRPRVSSDPEHAVLKVVIPKGKTLEQVMDTGSKALERLDKERDYQLREDLQETGQLQPGLSVAVSFAFEGDSDMEAVFRSEEATIAAETDPIKRANLQQKLDDAKALFQANLGTVCQFAGNNRAMHIRKCYETKDHHYFTGFQERTFGGKEIGSTLNMDWAFRQFSGFLNHAYQSPDHPKHAFAKSLVKLAKVPTRVVIGAENPARLLASLRSINNRDHGRPPLQFKEQAKARSQSKEVIGYFAANGHLSKILEKATLSPLHPLLMIKGGPEVLELVLTGDESWDLILKLLDAANGGKVDRLAVEVALVDLLRSIFLPDFQEGQDCIRTILLEPAKSQLLAVHAQKRMTVMLAAISGLLHLDINDRVMDGLVPVSVLREGLPYPVRSITTHLSVAQHNVTEAKEIWRWRLLPYLVGAGLVRADVGSMANREITYSTDDGGTFETLHERRTASNALQTLLHPQAKVFANQLAENLLAARDAYLEANPEKSEPFTAKAFKVTHDPFPLPAVADKAWFDRVFPKLTKNGRTASGLVDAVDPKEQLDRLRKDYINCLDDLAQEVGAVLRNFNPPCLDTLKGAAADLSAAAEVLANQTGEQVWPLSEEDSKDLARTLVLAWEQFNTREMPAFRERFKVFKEELSTLAASASQVVQPPTAFGQEGSLQELDGLDMGMDL